MFSHLTPLGEAESERAQACPARERVASQPGVAEPLGLGAALDFQPTVAGRCSRRWGRVRATQVRAYDDRA